MSFKLATFRFLTFSECLLDRILQHCNHRVHLLSKSQIESINGHWMFALSLILRKMRRGNGAAREPQQTFYPEKEMQ